MALGQIRKLGIHGKIFPSFKNDLRFISHCGLVIVAIVYMLFLTVSEQKSKVRLISEISVFSYLALAQIRKLGNLGNIFLSFRNDLNFISNYDLQLWQLFTCFS